MIWSKYQSNFFNELEKNEALFSRGEWRQNLQVGAVAGSGKSTCCLEGIRRVVKNGATVVYSMFTKETTEEFAGKIERAGLSGRVVVKTAHALGFAAFRRNYSRTRVWGKKVADIVDAWAVTLDEKDPVLKQKNAIERLVKFAKDKGIGIFSEIDSRQEWVDIIEHHGMSFGDEVLDDEEVSDSAKREFIIDKSIEFLKISNNDTSVIDFSDMIYLPLLLNCPFEQFDYVFVDESQDTNPIRRELFFRMIGPKGCMVDVGDECQAVMGFTGADNDAMEIIRTKLRSKVLPLSICYRCASSIVKHAQTWVSHIEPSPTAIEGSVTTMTYDNLLKDAGTLNLTKFDAILCRKNAPLAATAFSLIRKGIACRIEGKDIGYSLVALVNRWKVKNLPELRRKLSEFREREVEKAEKKGQKGKIENIHDKCDTLECLIERAEAVSPTIEGLKKIIYDMFSDASDPKTRKDIIVLSSIHKSKGREWDRVFLLGRSQFMPSPYAKQQWEKDQEKNLIYVAITRAKTNLIEVTNIPTDQKKKGARAEMEADETEE